ncbi:5'-3' exonuclease H3TH domain-containing protein, partial [Bacillus paralicheniformis]
MTERKKLVLVDGNSLAYRAFFALPLLSNEKGIHTNAVYGFTTILMKMLEEEKPTHMLVAFDAGKTTFRHKTFKEYKGGRQKTPPELSEQLPFIRELLDAYQILRYELENYEADDIIGTLAKSAEKDGFEVKIFSGDKDLTQLATEGTTVAITKKGITDVEYYTPEHVREKYGLTPEQIIDMKGLMGDSSDNIPGVPGVGEKTAIKLLKQFHTIEELLSSIDEVNGKKLKEKLEEFKEQALMSKELATITTEAPLEVTLDSLGYEGFDREAVVKIFKDLGFNSLLERIGEEPGEKEEEQFEEINVMIKTDITDDLFASPASLVVEQLGDNYHEAPILGFSIVNEHGAFFIPEETAVQSDRFKEWAEDESKKKWVFDAKRAAVALRWRGIELKGAEFDVLLAAYIINPGHSYDDVASVAKEH